MQILYLAPISYEYLRARPQWICSHLARMGHSVYYVNPPTLATSLTWKASDPRIREVIPQNGSSLVRVIFPRGIRLGSFKTKVPLETFFHGRWFAGFLAAEKIDRSEAAVIVANPRFWWSVIAGLGLKHLYYDCQDHWEVLSGAMSREEFRAVEADLVKNCRGVFVTSGPLKEHILSLGGDSRVHVVPNAIDWEALTGGAAKGETVESNSARKTVGLVGSIDHVWVNLDLVRKAALKYPEYDFVLVGPLADPSPAKKMLGGLPNVRLPGQVPYAEVGKWIDSFDLGIIPFNESELARFTEPIKAYEYMAFGKPVLAHQLPEMEKFGNLVKVTYDEEKFLQYIKELIEQDDPEMLKSRMACARENSWPGRVSEMIAIMENRD